MRLYPSGSSPSPYGTLDRLMPTLALRAALGITLVVGLATAPLETLHARPRSVVGVESLAAIVGEWQSDTVRGTSARSSCVWTPWRGGVMCEQRIDGPTGASTALNLFTTASATGEFALYVLSHTGDVVTSVPFSIRGRLWFYGGKTAAGDGRYHRTVNDFSRTDSYTWRQETSVDGKEWTSGDHGESRRVR